MHGEAQCPWFARRSGRGGIHDAVGKLRREGEWGRSIVSIACCRRLAMCLHPQPIDPIPEDTARVAHAAFPKGTFAMRVRDVLGTIYADEGFASVYPRRGRAAMAPWRLMLVT